MNPFEIAGAVFGLANILLLVRRSVWNFPAAMVMVSCIGFVMVETRLYAEAGLQAFFFLANVWGWALWSQARGVESAVPVGWLGWAERRAWLAGTIAASVAVGVMLARHTDAALPMVDSAVAGMSVTAQLLLAFRRIENWWLWIAVDSVSVALYLNRELYLLAGLYGIFLVLAVIGLREWTRAAQSDLRSAGEAFT